MRDVLRSDFARASECFRPSVSGAVVISKTPGRTCARRFQHILITPPNHRTLVASRSFRRGSVRKEPCGDLYAHYSSSLAFRS
jgi:hypothetical protein